MRGLPRGALARCPRTGLAVRAVDGVAPVLAADGGAIGTSESALHGAAVTGAGTRPARGTSARAGGGGPDVAAVLREELPGRVLVASLPPSRGDDDGNAPRPSAVVGWTFGRVRDLLRELRSLRGAAAAPPRVDRGMEVAADPSFAPLDFVAARLESGGVLPPGNTSGGGEDGPSPFIRVEWEGGPTVSGSVTWYDDFVAGKGAEEERGLQWAIIESTQRDHPSVLLGVPRTLLENSACSAFFAGDEEVISMGRDEEEADDSGSRGSFDAAEIVGNDGRSTSSGEDLLPVPVGNAASIRLSASLLQKSVRRGWRRAEPFSFPKEAVRPLPALRWPC